MGSRTDELAERFRKTRHQTRALYEPLATEYATRQPMEDVSPPLWHLAHTTWFFEAFLLKPFLTGYRPFSEAFDYLFNSYYEGVGERVARKNRGDIPADQYQKAMPYRSYVDQCLMDWIGNDAKKPDEVDALLELGLHHEEQHQELLLTDIQYILGSDPQQPAYRSDLPQSPSAAPAPLRYHEIDGGMVEIGYSGPKFSFDNERGLHQVYLYPFKIASRLTTNDEFLAFMEDDGYRRPELWHAEGWEWVQARGVQAPLYWTMKNKRWYAYNLSGLEPVHPHDPVSHVNYYEASAFAEWKRERLPTEFEWETACKRLNPSVPAEANLQESGALKPVEAGPSNGQFYGDAWEWTRSAYLPYPYFKKEPGAVGEYNGKFMVNQMVLRGGSCATPRAHIRPTYRNFFHPDKRWQFTGIRLAVTMD